MIKIPVGETIAHGYRFAGRKALTSLGLSWLTATFYAFAIYYWLQKFSTTMLVSPHPGGALNDFAIFDLFCLVFVTALASATIAVMLTQEALEPRGAFVAAYFLFARREWNLFLGLLAFYGIVLAALFAIIFAGGIAISVSLPLIGPDVRWQGISALSAMNAAVAFMAMAVCIFLTIRLGFFLASAATAEGSARLTYAWALSRGNFWRLLMIVATIVLPIVLLWAVIDWVLVGQQFGGALSDLLGVRHDSTALYQLISDNAGAFAVMCAVMLVLFTVLFAGSSAFAYPRARDSAYERERRVVQTFIEPSFAGSFAAASPVLVKEPDLANVLHETAAPLDVPAMDNHIPVENGAAALPAEIPVEEHSAEAPQDIESIVTEDVVETSIHNGRSVQAVPVAASQPEAPIDSIAAMPVPAAKPAAVATVTPPPSHGDGTEFSLPSAPSEAA